MVEQGKKTQTVDRLGKMKIMLGGFLFFMEHFESKIIETKKREDIDAFKVEK